MNSWIEIQSIVGLNNCFSEAVGHVATDFYNIRCTNNFSFSSIYKPYILLKPCIHNSIGVYTFYMVSNLCSFQFSRISYIAYLWHTLIAMCSTPGHDSQLILIVSCDLCMMYLLDEALELNVNRRTCNVDKLKKFIGNQFATLEVYLQSHITMQVHIHNIPKSTHIQADLILI